MIILHNINLLLFKYLSNTLFLSSKLSTITDVLRLEFDQDFAKCI